MKTRSELSTCGPVSISYYIPPKMKQVSAVSLARYISPKLIHEHPSVAMQQ